MFKRKWMLTLGILATFGIWMGCASSPKYLTSFNGPFTVEVLPTGPPNWSYDITASSQTGITSVEMISSADLSDADIEVEPLYRNQILTEVKTVDGLEIVLDRDSTHDLSFSLVSNDFENGLVYFKVTGEGGITRTVGPVAGPQ